MLGNVSKLQSLLSNVVEYQLPLGDQLIPLNPYIGKRITLNYSGKINCRHCGRLSKKSYSQGFCFPCMKKLAQCDMCILKPETCHYDQGTCREPQWGRDHCMQPHIVYLANTSGLKVGITRKTNTPTRWIDQGATQALPIFEVQTRLLSGLVEVAIAEFAKDKTNWRAMLKGDGEQLDLQKDAEPLIAKIQGKLDALDAEYGQGAITRLDEEPIQIRYPVDSYPDKISSFNLDKNPEVTGCLQGIKGQYLILDTGVINIRKYTGYELEFGGE